MNEFLLLESAASLSSSFNAFEWVEDVLSSHVSNETLALNVILPQLTLRSQSLAQTLQTSLQHISLAGPELQTRLQELQQVTAPLGQCMDIVHKACGSTSISTASSQDLHHLVTLHETKRRLESCLQTLVETTKWKHNVRTCFAAVEDPLLLSCAVKGDTIKQVTTSNADDLADRVREMQKSLNVLKDLPGATERKKTMDRLCVQIEVALLPRLTSKLQEEDLGDVAPLRWCLDVLHSVDKAQLMRDEFCRARPGQVHRIWHAYNDKMQTGPDDTDDKKDGFVSWLDTFYTEVLRMLQRESRNAREIFGADMLSNILFTLLLNTLKPCTKSFQDCLVDSGPSDSSFCLGRLLHCFHLTRGFAVQVVQLFQSLKNELGVMVVESDDDRAASAEGILRVVFEPYRLYFTEYARFSSNGLTDALLRLVPSFNMTNNENLDKDTATTTLLEDFSRQLEEASKEVWMRVDESVQQCYEFTGGASFPEAVEAIGAAVQQFSLALSATMTDIRKLCKAEPTMQGAALESMVASPDWSQFHASLYLLKACGTLESQLCAIDGQLRVRMREQLAQFFGGTSGSLSPRSRRKEIQDQSSIALADLVDPTRVVAVVSKAWLRDEDPTRQSQFHQFAMEVLDPLAESSGFDTNASRYPTAKLLNEAQRAVRSWTREVQLLTHDTIFLPIARELDTLPNNESWCKVPDATLGDLPTFSMLPQDYITIVADLLLSLLPQLQPFAESSSLESAVVASRGAQEACVYGEWTRLSQILQLEPPELLTCQRIFGSDDKTVVSESVSTATEFVDLWTTAVASSTLAALLRTVCSISMLSEMGAQQLAADLGYFHNVLSAVGSESNFIVNNLRCALEMDLQTHIYHVEALRADHDSPEKQVLAKLNDRIIAMRQRVLKQSSSTSSQLFQ